MEAALIYEDSEGNKFVKVKVEFIMDVPIDDEITEIDNDAVHDKIMEMNSSDLADEIFEHIENFHIVTKSDNIQHVEVNNVLPYHEFKPIEIDYLSFELFTEIVKSEMVKGNTFAEIIASFNQEFCLSDLDKMKAIGFDVYRENNKYIITWDNFE